MRLGLLHVIECPHCRTQYSLRALFSGNTFGARGYSDGKTITPRLPEYPSITKCDSCGNIFWLNDAKEVGSYEWDKMIAYERKRLKPIRFLTIDEYFTALNPAVRKSEDELFIRQNIWWAYNDIVRNEPNKLAEFLDEERWQANSQVLLQLLSENDLKQLLIIAELHRNLGYFERCREIINTIDDDEVNWIKPQFIMECEKRNRRVFKITTHINSDGREGSKVFQAITNFLQLKWTTQKLK